MRWFYHLGRGLVRIGLFLTARWQVRGKENIPEQGPLLVAANHLNVIDPPVISVSIKRETYFMAKEELFRSALISSFLRGLGAFPVFRNQADLAAIRAALQILAEGKGLVIFPESTRSRNAKMQKGFSGTALIALRSGAAILPIGISGTEQLRGKFWLLRRPKIIVNIGKPFFLPEISGRATSLELERLTSIIMGKIAGLLPPEMQGYYGKQKESHAVQD